MPSSEIRFEDPLEKTLASVFPREWSSIITNSELVQAINGFERRIIELLGIHSNPKTHGERAESGGITEKSIQEYPEYIRELILILNKVQRFHDPEDVAHIIKDIQDMSADHSEQIQKILTDSEEKKTLVTSV
ncbi:hypothetical protein K9M59_03190 [Candidatus Gracilibacteria bacterium]|nr:hypothetical protein [Candidatus Gracilibacteria bacterium]MCF7819335.1 hypothetical protein [Candidatus Gracilibacteria bacterium]